MDLYTYLVSSRNKTFDREGLKAFKLLKAYKYFADNLVRNVHAGHIPADDLVAIKAHCLSSLKASTTYFTFLALKRNGKVVAAQCSCVAGQGEACSHVAALMFYLEDKMRQKDMHLPADTSSTGRLQQWHMPSKRVVQPKSLKSISFRKAEYGKQLPSASNLSAVVTPTPILLPASPTADIVGLVSDVQQAVSNSGITHFWVKPDTQTQRSASESALAAAAQSLILFSSSCPNDLPASATDLADANTSAPYFLELCEAFTQGQTISQELADYIHAITKDQATSALWLDLRNGRLTSSMFGMILNQREETNPTTPITRIMGYKAFTAIPAAMRWGRDNEDRARRHYVAHMKRAGFKDIKVSPSGLSLMPAYSFIGASGDGWIHEPRDHGVKKGVLEIKCPFSINNSPVHCMAPKVIAMEYPSFFMEVHEDTIQLKRSHSHYMQVQGEMGVMECEWCHFVIWTEDSLFVEEIPFDEGLWKDTILPKLATFYKDKLVPEILCRNIQQNLSDTSK